MILEFFNKGMINYELLKHQKLKRLKNGNIDLKIKFCANYFSKISVKIHRKDQQIFIAFLLFRISIYSQVQFFSQFSMHV